MPPIRRQSAGGYSGRKGQRQGLLGRLPHPSGRNLGGIAELFDLQVQAVPDVAAIAMTGEHRAHLIRSFCPGGTSTRTNQKRTALSWERGTARFVGPSNPANIGSVAVSMLITAILLMAFGVSDEGKARSVRRRDVAGA
jgi:hypothetical protein